MNSEQSNPYTSSQNTVREQSNRTYDRLSCIAASSNVFFLLVAIGLRRLLFTFFDDPYTNPLFDVSAISFICSIASGMMGLILVVNQISKKQRIPILMFVWFILAGAYISWFAFNFVGFMFVIFAA
jgi:hypothetical protein